MSQISITSRMQNLNNADNFKNVSLYIPHVFPNYSAEDVAAVFERLRIGKVSQVDMVPKRDNNNHKYFAAYIHFQHWFDNTAARNFQARLMNPAKEARIVYDDPWYWIVLPYKNKMSFKKNKKPIKANFAVSRSSEDSEYQSAKVYPDDSDSVASEMEEVMELLEETIAENEKYMVTIDSRYVQALEQENVAWRHWAQYLTAQSMQPVVK
jgi:hypothetical protein